MSNDYNIVYPPRGRVTLDGGKNSKYERALIADNESPDALNVVFNNAAVGTRGGSTKLNTAAIGSFAFDGLYTRRANTGAETMVAFAGGSAWQLAGTSLTTIGSAQSVFTAGQRVGTAQYENHMFIGNGGVTPYKWNGTDFTRHGVPRAVISGFSGAVSATGGTFPAATYLYKVVYVNAQSVEGDVSSASTALAVGANGSVEISGIPVAPVSHGVSSRRLYRASGVAGTYERIATIADNTTTTFSDTYFPASTTAPTDQGEPPKYSVICQHQNRLFMNDAANPNYVWYTELFEPYTVKTTSFQPIGDASFDLVRCLDVYDNGIIVRCDRAAYLWYMPSTDPTDWTVIKLRSPYGSKSPFGAFLYNNKFMFPAMENDKFVGFAAISGATIDPEATALEQAVAGSDRKSDRVEDEMFDVWEAAVGQISAMVFKNKAYIAVPSGTSQTSNNRIFIFDFSISNLNKKQEASWVPATGRNVSQFTIYNGKLYGGSATANGFVYELETTSYNDDGSAINSYFWTKEFAGNKGHENYVKDFRKLYLLVEKSGSYNMNLNYRVDSDNGEGAIEQIDLTNDSDTWGTKNWGTMVWGAGTAQEEVEIPLGTASGKRIQFKFSNQNAANQRFQVLGLNFTYNLKGRR